MKQGTLTTYIAGYIASVALTIAAYFAVVHPAYFNLSGSDAILVAILALAVVQLVVQLFFFLHLGFVGNERWKMAAFLATVGLVLIIVVGSIWIMSHLNYQMMASPAEMNQYIQNQQGGF